jgi:hypothetical protein
MDTHNTKGKVAPRWSNLQAIGRGWVARGRHAPCSRSIGRIRWCASNPHRVGRWVPRESEVSFPSWGVGEQERSLTGDATAKRCDDTFHPCRNLQRRSRAAWGDGCGSRQRDATGERSVSLAKMPVIHRTSWRSTLSRNLAIAESVEPTR